MGINRYMEDNRVYLKKLEKRPEDYPAVTAAKPRLQTFSLRDTVKQKEIGVVVSNRTVSERPLILDLTNHIFKNP